MQTGPPSGTLLNSGYGVYLNVKNGKYFFTFGFDGTFPTAQIWWTGANCTGTPYLNDGDSGDIGQFGITAAMSYAFTPVYSAVRNELYVLSSPDSNGVSTSMNIPGGSISIENPTCMNNTGNAAQPASGWPITTISPGTIGFSATGTPLKVATPLQLP